jgi:hypothetical protein
MSIGLALGEQKKQTDVISIISMLKSKQLVHHEFEIFLEK